eukprot:scaffold13251_cov20-Tisochrysis_lutea.AAC.6
MEHVLPEALGSLVELGTRDERLGLWEYGGVQVKMQFMTQLCNLKLRERCCGSARLLARVALRLLCKHAFHKITSVH